MKPQIKYHDGISLSLKQEKWTDCRMIETSAPKGWYVLNNDGMTGGARWFGPYQNKYDIPAYYHPMFHPMMGK